MKTEKTDVGTWEGFEVAAITDSMGSQVVLVRGDEKDLSVPFANHEAAVEMARRVLTEGRSACGWEGPPQTAFDLFQRIYSRN